MRFEEAGGGLAGRPESSGDPQSQLMTLPALRARIDFSSMRPPVCIPTAAALSEVRSVVEAVAESENPAGLCRAMGQRAFNMYQSFLISEAGLTVEMVVGRPQPDGGSTPSTSAPSSTSAPTGTHAGGSTDGAATRVVSNAPTGGSPSAPPSADPVGAGAVAAVETPGDRERCTSSVVVDACADSGSGLGVGGAPPPFGSIPLPRGDDCTGTGGTSAEGASLAGSDLVGPTNASGATDWTDAMPPMHTANSDGTGSPVTSSAKIPVLPTEDFSKEAGAGGGVSEEGDSVAAGSVLAAAAAGGSPMSATLSGSAAAAATTGVEDVHHADNESAGVVDAGRIDPRGEDIITSSRDSTPATHFAASSDTSNDEAASKSTEVQPATVTTQEQGGPSSGKTLVLGYLIAYLRTKRLTPWKFPGTKKGPAPPGTVANPPGNVTVDKSRSLWCHRVSMVDMKPSFDSPKLAGHRFKHSNVSDEMLVGDLNDFKSKKIGDVVAALLLLCTYEPEAARIVNEISTGSFAARPSRHSSLVLSGLELERVGNGDGAAEGAGGSTAAGSVSDGDYGHAPPSNGSVPADAAVGAGGEGVERRPGNLLPARGDFAAGDAGIRVGGNGGAGGVAGSNHGVRGATRGNDGGPADGDGIREGRNVAVEAVYYLRAMREAANCRAQWLAVRRASRAKCMSAVRARVVNVGSSTAPVHATGIGEA